MTYLRDSHLDLQKGDKLCASETVRPGKNGHYDIRLIQRAGRNLCEAEIYMKLQFFFVDGDRSKFASANGHKWTPAEKRGFMSKWRQQIKQHWDKRRVTTLSNGYVLDVMFLFEIQEAGWMWDHFELTVTKIPGGGFETSKVKDDTVTLDSNDIRPKSSGQHAAVHEFGHMIGNPDEYKSHSAHFGDKTSIMHGGTGGRTRHYDHIVSWCEKNKCKT